MLVESPHLLGLSCPARPAFLPREVGLLVPPYLRTDRHSGRVPPCTTTTPLTGGPRRRLLALRRKGGHFKASCELAAVQVDPDNRSYWLDWLCGRNRSSLRRLKDLCSFYERFCCDKTLSAAFCRPSVTNFFAYVVDLSNFLNLKLRLCIGLYQVRRQKIRGRGPR